MTVRIWEPAVYIVNIAKESNNSTRLTISQTERRPLPFARKSLSIS